MTGSESPLRAALDLRVAQLGKEAARIGRAEFDQLASDFALTRPELYDQIGAYLAVRYQAGRLDFDTCDRMANALFGLVLDEDHDFSETLFWDVYLAFDEGEYHHTRDRSDDPEAEHTRPMIARIVRERELS